MYDYIFLSSGVLFILIGARLFVQVQKTQFTHVPPRYNPGNNKYFMATHTNQQGGWVQKQRFI